MLATVVNVPPVTKIPPIVTKDGVMAGPNFDDVPVRTQCPQCRKAIMTQTKRTVGLGTWLIVILLLCLPPLCLIPFFVNAVKDTEHRCPNCGNLLGVKKIVG
jgi:lipopolysaccharide-induced tumor necrosis factor-alpha factor